MNIIALGGWMMWPLLAVSILTLTVIVERLLLYASCPLPDDALRGDLLKATSSGDVDTVAERMAAVPLLQAFAQQLTAASSNRESSLRLAGGQILEQLERRLGLLGAIARLAPLMGLLGTVSGMISIFSSIAHASSGVDMSMLADGIWQALLNTASGLCIAIVAQFSLAFFSARLKNISSMLDAAGNAALLQPDHGTAC
ncbi:MAG: hypothetical protein BCS36_09175 [Desulfovibrio sp. MES5]|uniref:MotA/TolQ/ExbB proton channel family protein n=1 Tax=Desulfovibrio sp. MES5 TaxID=1899016 RepID=UPI000B9CA7F0|nr:MotA/TolQ/ExbB proton channel family protein [Desulfovibrio sp. MES5]OXS28903.1 MAG: hypothetical protein BCS36_09175 [Desulfovibrio sp. MES5]